jgi:hypothetical protein
MKAFLLFLCIFLLSVYHLDAFILRTVNRLWLLNKHQHSDGTTDVDGGLVEGGTVETPMLFGKFDLLKRADFERFSHAWPPAIRLDRIIKRVDPPILLCPWGRASRLKRIRE